MCTLFVFFISILEYMVSMRHKFVSVKSYIHYVINRINSGTVCNQI